MKTNNKPAIIYTRGVKSGSEKDQRLLVEGQAMEAAYRVLTTFSDTCSGTSAISQRPWWQKLLEAIQADRNIHDLIIYDESRISRRAFDVARESQNLSDMNVTVRYAANDFQS